MVSRSQSPTTAPRTVVEALYTNVSDLRAPNLDPEALAQRIYRDGSAGDYEERSFLVDLTHDPENGLGAWPVSAPGEYLLQLVIEDVSGNVGVRDMTINVLP